MIPRIGFETLPEEINRDEYEGLVNACKQSNRGQILSRVYKKKNTSGSYYLDLAASQDDLDEIWDFYVKNYRKKLAECVTEYLVAYYIWCHRNEFQRKGDRDDDFNKAHYLIALVEYLNNIRPRVIRLAQGPELDEVINMVNNIFDSAYFRKLREPNLTDEKCFRRAEREFCEEKGIDFMMAELELEDRRVAERLYEDSKIIAWIRREGGTQETEIPTNDWELKRVQYRRLKSKERIAKICWIIYPDKSNSPEHYWGIADEIIRILEGKNIDYVGVNPYKPVIFDVISRKIGVRKNEKKVGNG